MGLEPIVPLDLIWHAQQPLRFGPLALSSRMTVIRLGDSGLWVHSPIAPAADLVTKLDRLGPVRCVVAPSRTHHAFFLPFIESYPGAWGFVPQRIAAKRPDLASWPAADSQTEAAPWAADLEPIHIDGLPVLDESVWWHAATGTLIVADLLFCFGARSFGPTRFFAKRLGVYRRLAMFWTMQRSIADRGAFARSIRRLLPLDVRRVVLAHDQIIEEDAATKLNAAFAWLNTSAAAAA